MPRTATDTHNQISESSLQTSPLGIVPHFPTAYPSCLLTSQRPKIGGIHTLLNHYILKEFFIPRGYSVSFANMIQTPEQKLPFYIQA